MLVIDASAAFRLLLGNRLDPTIERNSELLAPDLIVSELLNAHWKTSRSGGLSPSASAVVGFLKRIQIVPSLEYAPGAVQLSEQLDHPIYDCVYVAIARQKHLKLLTSDARLERKLRAHKLGAVLAQRP